MLPREERKFGARWDKRVCPHSNADGTKPHYDPLGDILAEMCRLLDEENRKRNLRRSRLSSGRFVQRKRFRSRYGECSLSRESEDQASEHPQN